MVFDLVPGLFALDTLLAVGTKSSSKLLPGKLIMQMPSMSYFFSNNGLYGFLKQDMPNIKPLKPESSFFHDLNSNGS